MVLVIEIDALRIWIALEWKNLISAIFENAGCITTCSWNTNQLHYWAFGLMSISSSKQSKHKPTWLNFDHLWCWTKTRFYTCWSLNPYNISSKQNKARVLLPGLLVVRGQRAECDPPWHYRLPLSISPVTALQLGAFHPPRWLTTSQTPLEAKQRVCYRVITYPKCSEILTHHFTQRHSGDWEMHSGLS